MGTNLAKKPDIANSTKTAVDEQRPFMLDYPFAYPHNHRSQPNTRVLSFRRCLW
jgi:hypothetical protein